MTTGFTFTGGCSHCLTIMINGLLQGQNNDLHNCTCILMNVEYSTATHDLLKWMSHLWVEAEASSEAVSLVCTDSTSYLALSYERVA